MSTRSCVARCDQRCQATYAFDVYRLLPWSWCAAPHTIEQRSICTSPEASSAVPAAPLVLADHYIPPGSSARSDVFCGYLSRGLVCDVRFRFPPSPLPEAMYTATSPECRLRNHIHRGDILRSYPVVFSAVAPPLPSPPGISSAAKSTTDMYPRSHVHGGSLLLSRSVSMALSAMAAPAPRAPDQSRPQRHISQLCPAQLCLSTGTTTSEVVSTTSGAAASRTPSLILSTYVVSSIQIDTPQGRPAWLNPRKCRLSLLSSRIDRSDGNNLSTTVHRPHPQHNPPPSLLLPQAHLQQRPHAWTLCDHTMALSGTAIPAP